MLLDWDLQPFCILGLHWFKFANYKKFNPEFKRFNKFSLTIKLIETLRTDVVFAEIAVPHAIVSSGLVITTHVANVTVF
jgi:hypothetical protein